MNLALIIKKFWNKLANFFLLTVFIFPQPSLSKNNENKVWVKVPQMPFKEFKAHVTALGLPHTSYAQNLLLQKREQTHSFKLKDKLLVAQEFYLSGEGKKALKAFKKITDLALSADWDIEGRRIILYSFLRRAQSEEDPEKRKALLLLASDFSLFKINGLNYPDYDLFPPPLMEELRLIQEKANVLSVNLRNIFPNHEIILINGEQIQKDEKIKVPQAFYRISAFSSSHQLWSQNLNFSELLTRKIKTKSLTEGSCTEPRITQNWKAENTEILLFSDCPKSIVLNLEEKKTVRKKEKNNQAFLKTLSVKNNNLNQLENFDELYELDSSLLNSEELSESLKDLNLEDQTWFSNIPPWLIIGAGAATFILIISLSSPGEKESPTKGVYVY